jgi:pimeloyl-ACP methyl ester carboxylesterase
MPLAHIEGISINYEHYRSANSGDHKRVVYIHGTGCNAKVFEPHMRALSPRHEVVAIDLPGHGGSAGNGFRSATEHAFFVGALIEHLGWEHCVVAGHSLGGGIALAVAIYFRPLVQALLLIDTGARLRVSPQVIESARRAAIAQRTITDESRFGYASTTPQAVIEHVNALNAGCDPRVIYKDWIADDSFDVMSRLPQIDVPSLAICGDQDPLTPPKYHEYLRDRLPDCRLEIVEDAGHWPFFENPECFNALVLAYLDSL